MATIAALAAALMAAAMVALASATTTTVTTTTLSEGSPLKKLVCWQQLQGRDLSSCQQYLSPYGGVLEMSTGQQGQVEECCQELRAVDRVHCGCEAIKKVVQQAQQEQGGSWSYETGKSESQSESEQIYRKASSLPTICRLRDQQCQIPLVLV